MSAKRMNWSAVSAALGISTETCTIYRAPPKKYSKQKHICDGSGVLPAKKAKVLNVG